MIPVNRSGSNHRLDFQRIPLPYIFSQLGFDNSTRPICQTNVLSHTGKIGAPFLVASAGGALVTSGCPGHLGNIFVTTSYQCPVLASAVDGNDDALGKGGNHHIVWMFEDCMRPSRLMTGTRK